MKYTADQFVTVEYNTLIHRHSAIIKCVHQTAFKTRMWANAQRDGRPAEYRWRPLFNAAKFD